MNALDLKNAYLANFTDWEKTALTKDPFWIRETREKALVSFGEMGFPTSRDESWKNTRLDPLFGIPFNLQGERLSKEAVLPELKSLGFETDRASVMVFVNGHFSKALSALREAPPKVKVRSLIESLSDGPLKRYFSHILPMDNRPFVALNYAYFTDGLFLHVPDGEKLDAPLHVVYLSTNSGQPTQSHLRNLLLLGEGASATVIEHYWGNNLNPYFTNAVTKVSLDKGALLDHTKIQHESPLAFHIGALAARQSGGSRLVSRVFSLGGALGRSEVETVLVEKKAECVLEGLFLGRGQQQLDHRTFIDHSSAACTSRENYKGVVDEEASGIFDGRVLVRENAQKTDARQSNRNLELSGKARVYSRPQLRIYADDVKCSHGSATGQLDEEALFYLQSRGLGREEARRTLVYAFAAEMVEGIPEDYVRGPLVKLVREWMEGEGGRKE